MNAFVLAAAVRAARKHGKGEERQAENFASMCRSARYGGPGYRRVGFEFAKDVVRQVKKWPKSNAKLRELKNILERIDRQPSRRDYAPLLRWCEWHIPRWVESIPSRRRVRFAEGFCDAYDGGFTKLKR